MAAFLQMDHHYCCCCCLPVAGSDVVTLPCNHQFCIECVDQLVQQKNRRWCLPCQKPGCGSKFALPFVPDMQCELKPVVSQQCVPDKYLQTVVAVNRLEVGSKIRGLALLQNTLYVASNDKFLLKYDVPGHSGNIIIPSQQQCGVEIKWPRGMAMSRRLSTVYVIDWSKMFGGTLWILRNDVNSTFKVELSAQPFGVSVSESSCVEDGVRIFVTCATPAIDDQAVLVFLDDGKLVCKMAALELPERFAMPRQSVRMPNVFTDEFAVCHGWMRFTDHRVSIVRKEAGNADQLEETACYGTRGTVILFFYTDMDSKIIQTIDKVPN